MNYNRLIKFIIFEPIVIINRLNMYNWQLSDWPNFTYNLEEIQVLFTEFAMETGEVTGIIQSLSEELQQETSLQIMLAEAVKSSEIEGEYVSRQDVISSLKKNLGLADLPVTVKDKRASGLAELMLAVRSAYNRDLTIPMICEWHTMLMSENRYITVGAWRKGDEPMQIVSGTIGKEEEVHFEAPPSDKVPEEMERFINWYNQESFQDLGKIPKALLKSSIAHLYFETIHPFEDGNGRIGRAIAEHALSNSLNRPVLLSLSKSIEKDKKRYYQELKNAQRTLDITQWIHYFIKMGIDAQQDAKGIALLTVKKAKLFDRHGEKLNQRQVKVIRKILEKGPEGFEGGITAKKYMAITGSSKATATRDLQELFDLGILLKEGAGRSVRYFLA